MNVPTHRLQALANEIATYYIDREEPENYAQDVVDDFIQQVVDTFSGELEDEFRQALAEVKDDRETTLAEAIRDFFKAGGTETDVEDVLQNL